MLTEWKSQFLKKKIFFGRLGFFFKMGKKSPKFHWEWGCISALDNTKKKKKIKSHVILKLFELMNSTKMNHNDVLLDENV